MTAMSLLLLDGASMWFRSFFGVPSSITAPDGRPVNAVRGFLDAVATVITRERPSRLVVCRDDDWRPQWRVDLIPSYKAHRVAEEEPAGTPDVEEVPDDLTPQVDMIMEILDAFGIATAGATIRCRCGCCTSAAAWPKPSSGGRRKWRTSTACRSTAPGPRTPNWRCCGATRPTGCPACPASARRRPPRCSHNTVRWRTS